MKIYIFWSFKIEFQPLKLASQKILPFSDISYSWSSWFRKNVQIHYCRILSLCALKLWKLVLFSRQKTKTKNPPPKKHVESFYKERQMLKERYHLSLVVKGKVIDTKNNGISNISPILSSEIRRRIWRYCSIWSRGLKKSNSKLFSLRLMKYFFITTSMNCKKMPGFGTHIFWLCIP